METACLAFLNSYLNSLPSCSILFWCFTGYFICKSESTQLNFMFTSHYQWSQNSDKKKNPTQPASSSTVNTNKRNSFSRFMKTITECPLRSFQYCKMSAWTSWIAVLLSIQFLSRFQILSPILIELSSHSSWTLQDCSPSITWAIFLVNRFNSSPVSWSAQYFLSHPFTL